MTFMDYEKVLTLIISAFMQKMKRQRVDKPYTKVLEGINRGNTVTTNLDQKDVRLFDTISPKLFIACLEEVFKNLN